VRFFFHLIFENEFFFLPAVLRTVVKPEWSKLEDPADVSRAVSKPDGTQEVFFITGTSPFTTARADNFLSMVGQTSSPQPYVPFHKDLDKAALATVFSTARHGNSAGQWDSHKKFQQDKWPLPEIYILKVEVGSFAMLDSMRALPKQTDNLSHHLKWFGTVDPGYICGSDGQRIPCNTATGTAHLDFQSIVSFPLHELADHLSKKRLAAQIQTVQKRMDVYQASAADSLAMVEETQKTLEQLQQQRSLEEIYGQSALAPVSDGSSDAEPSTVKRQRQ
jgi:hypothetical protein